MLLSTKGNWFETCGMLYSMEAAIDHGYVPTKDEFVWISQIKEKLNWIMKNEKNL